MVKLVPVSNPRSPWESSVVDYLGQPPQAGLKIYEDRSRSILSENRSPDVGFRYSVNPYRGCLHGCSYCYARPSHEYLGFGSGVDFERKIAVKPDAPRLLRGVLQQPGWKGDLIVFSGNTDCYQPIEASYGLTRGCLEVCAEHRNPVHVITKGALVERDVDVLSDLSGRASASVSISIPFWSAEHARKIEPYAPSPRRRVRTVERLAAADIPVSVMVAPVIPGLTDREIPQILQAAAAAGARSASMVMLRLPGNVREVFVERLRRDLPLAAERVLARTREVRHGNLNDARFGSRMRGEGEYALAVERLFESTAARLGLSSARSALAAHPPAGASAPQVEGPPRGRQLSLFE